MTNQINNQSIILSTDVIQLTLTLKMTTVQVVEMSVTVNNSPSYSCQDYIHPDDQTQPTFEYSLWRKKTKCWMDHPEGNVCPFSTMGPIIWLWGIRGVGHFRLKTEKYYCLELLITKIPYSCGLVRESVVQQMVSVCIRFLKIIIVHSLLMS